MPNVKYGKGGPIGSARELCGMRRAVHASYCQCSGRERVCDEYNEAVQKGAEHGVTNFQSYIPTFVKPTGLEASPSVNQ